jgi:hypothetical protein
MSYFERYRLEIRPPSDPWNSRVDPELWRNDVERQLIKIESVDAGRALLDNMTKKTDGSDLVTWIIVEQYPNDYRNPLVCNAETKTIGGTYLGFRQYRAKVFYEPGQYHKGSYCYQMDSLDDANKNRGRRADEVLFHELTHAHRFALRMRNYDEVRGGLRKYTSPEEFLAVVMTNIYISDLTNTNASGLRGSHQGGEPLEAGLRDSIAFYAASADVYPIISKFADEEWPLFNALAGVRSLFNPMRALREHEDWVKEASRSQAAQGRDIAGNSANKVAATKGSGAPQAIDVARSVFSPLAKSAIGILRK